MSKDKKARYEFDTSHYHLCQLIEASLVSEPGVRKRPVDADGTICHIALKLLFLVHACLIKQEGNDWLGQEAVVYMSVNNDGTLRSDDETAFASFLNLSIDTDLRLREWKRIFLQCRFSKPDCVWEFQSIIDWTSAGIELVRSGLKSLDDYAKEANRFDVTVDHVKRVLHRFSREARFKEKNRPWDLFLLVWENHNNDSRDELIARIYEISVAEAHHYVESFHKIVEETNKVLSAIDLDLQSNGRKKGYRIVPKPT